MLFLPCVQISKRDWSRRAQSLCQGWAARFIAEYQKLRFTNLADSENVGIGAPFLVACRARKASVRASGGIQTLLPVACLVSIDEESLGDGGGVGKLSQAAFSFGKLLERITTRRPAVRAMVLQPKITAESTKFKTRQYLRDCSKWRFERRTT
jgi:hypothetical protein